MRTQKLQLYKTPKSWDRGASPIKEALWIFIFQPIVSNSFPGSRWRKVLLNLFGAKIGKNNRFNQGLKVKMPWRLTIGNNCWIGEDTWIDNLSFVKISDSVCVSQGVYFCTGNHNYKKETFDLITEPIFVETEVWIGAKSIIGPGTNIGRAAIITLGSIITKDISPYNIYRNYKTT